METTYIGTAEAAEVLGCHKVTVIRWVEQGRLAAKKLPGENGPYLFDRADVDALAARLADEKDAS
ncbi:MAG: helix-turn-helix domain-containing protein [Streptosporangiales bacterium]